MSAQLHALDERGLLPEGVHEVTFDEVERLFGQVRGTTHRHSMCERLKEYIGELRRWGLGEAIVIDGSFVMGSVDRPGDIDVVVEMPEGWPDRELLPVEENLLGKRARSTYSVEVTPLVQGSGAAQSRIDFYRQVNVKWCQSFAWPPNLKKGLLRVIL